MPAGIHLSSQGRPQLPHKLELLSIRVMFDDDISNGIMSIYLLSSNTNNISMRFLISI